MTPQQPLHHLVGWGCGFAVLFVRLHPLPYNVEFFSRDGRVVLGCVAMTLGWSGAVHRIRLRLPGMPRKHVLQELANPELRA